MNQPEFDPSKQLLPLGFWLRLVIVFALFLGGIVCMFTYSNVVIGLCISLCAPVFAKLSGFKEMQKKYKAALQSYEANKAKQ